MVKILYHICFFKWKIFSGGRIFLFFVNPPGKSGKNTPERLKNVFHRCIFYRNKHYITERKIMAEENGTKDHLTANSFSGDDLKKTEKRNRFKERFFLYGAFFLPVLLLTFLRMICTQLQGGEPGTDNFYHAAMALAGQDIFTAKKFPFLALSSWHDTFADKELLYHILLQGLFYVQKIISGKTFPFTFPAMFFVSIALASFVVLLHTLKIPSRIIFLSSLLFSTGAFAFTYRFLMLRPHVFSIAIILSCCILFAMIRDKSSLKKYGTLLFLLSFVYAWSYSNPHFILFPVIVYAFFAKKEYGKKIFFLPFISIAGLLAGYLIHPQFPNTFIIWKVQSLDALLNPVLGTGSPLTPKLVPMEMLPGNFSWYRNMLPFYVLCYGCLFFFIRLKEKKESGFSCTPVEKTILFLAAFFTLCTFAVLRSVEYAVPFTAASGGILLKYAVQEKTAFFEKNASCNKILYLFTAAALALAALNTNLMLKSNYKTKSPEKMAKYLQENTPENSLVINLDWGDFPAMFYANKHNTLLWGMDPAFSYAFAPAKARKLENCVLNSIRHRNVDSRIHELTGAEYAFVLSRREKFVQYLKDCSWQVVYESEEGAVFSLKKNAGILGK